MILANRFFFLHLIFFAVFLALPVSAIDFSEEAELEFGDSFEFAEPETKTPVDQENGSSRWTLQYQYSKKTKEDQETVTNRSSVRFEWNRLFAEHFFFLLDGKATLFFENDHQTEAREKELYSQGNLRELYTQISYGDYNLKIGKQILVWGEAEAGIATDVISPRDQSEFAFITLEDSRVGQYMITASGFSGTTLYEVFLNPYPEFNKEPETGTEYFITSPFLSSAEIKEDDTRIPEYGFRIKTVFNDGDLSLMGARVQDNQAVYEYRGMNAVLQPVLQKTWKPYSMVGLAGNLASGNFLWKGETAYKINRFFQTTQLNESKGLQQSNQWDSSIGFDYDAQGDYSLFFELAHSHIEDWSKDYAYLKQDETTGYVSVTQNFFNETFSMSYNLSHQFRDSSNMYQLKSLWKITDDLHLGGDYTHFIVHSENNFLWSFKNADRLSLDLSLFF